MNLPPAIFKQHCAILGKTGAGKSYAARGMVETLLAEHRRVCVIDPKGDWHGVKLSADGKRGPFKVIGFGDFKEPTATDIAINPRAGREVAELVATGNRPCVIGFRGWMPGDRTRFWMDFAATLFNKNHGELFLVIDEVHNFAMQGKTMDPESAKCLHWTNRIASEGRGIGIRLIMASQRPQKVHKDTLTCAETLIAMRVIHPLDRAAMKDWIDGCGDSSKGKAVLDQLANMARGQAWVWSPEIGFLEKVSFPSIETFDSFSDTATLARPQSVLTWEGTDLDEVRNKLSSIVEEAKSNDPRELRARIARLEAQLRNAPVAPLPEPVEVSILKDEDRAMLAQVQTTVSKMVSGADDLKRALDSLGAKLPFSASAVNAAVRHMTPQTLPARNSPLLVAGPDTRRKIAHDKTLGIAKGERAVLVACAQYGDSGVSKETLTVLTGYKRSSRDAYLQRLRDKALIAHGGEGYVATADGIKALGSDFEPLPTGPELLAHWLGRLPDGERRVLEVLVSFHPQAISREQIDAETGYKRSSRDAYLQRLSARRLVERDSSGVKAADILF